MRTLRVQPPSRRQGRIFHGSARGPLSSEILPYEYLLPSVLAAAAVAAVPILVAMVCYLLSNSVGAAAVAVNGAVVPAILALLLLLYSMLGVVQMAAQAAHVFAGRALWVPVAAVVAVVVSIPVTITWLFWLRGAEWPIASPTSYLWWVAGIAGFWLLLMPGALLQATMLLRKSSPAMRHPNLAQRP